MDRVPLSRMEQKDAEKLLAMEAELRKTVIGQEEAVVAISKALRRSRADSRIRTVPSAHLYSSARPAWARP